MHNVVGHFLLNLSFLLYLILYLPQLVFNSKYQKFEHLSFYMHIMLLQAYWCDVFYALGRHMPWQYLTVAIIGVIYLLIQHGQWMVFNHRHHKNNIRFVISALLASLIPLLLFTSFREQAWQIHIQAWVSRILFVIHFIPQIIKYHQKQNNRDAISLWYLNLSLSLSACDLLSAYCLKWDLANQMGSLISLSLKCYLYTQILWFSKFKPKLSFLKTLSAR